MTYITNLTDQELLKRVEDCSLNAKYFSHKAMLRLAWILIQKFGVENAISKNFELKKHYYTSIGKESKFNEPLSRAYVEILYYFMQKSPKSDFEKLMREYPRLIFNFKNLVKTHYGYNVLSEPQKNETSKPEWPILFTF